MTIEHVQIEVWYHNDEHPDLRQCLIWMTVDEAPEYARSKAFMMNVAEASGNTLLECLIREIDPPVSPTHYGTPTLQ